MDKERFVEIIKTGKFTEAHLEELNLLMDEYPWFALPRFLRLKAYEQMERTPEATELNRAVVFSSERKHLYDWVKGTFDFKIGTSGQGSTELEFLDSEEEDAGEESDNEEPFVLLDDDVEKDDDADAKPIPEKDEAEMEEPELDAPEAVPVIDPLDDDEDEEDGDEEEDEEDADTGGKLPEDAKVADAAAEAGTSEKAESAGAGSGAGDETAGTKPGEGTGETDDENVSKGRSALLGSRGYASGSRQQTTRTNPSTDLIERFLKKEPGVIRADHQTNLEGDVSEGSVKEDDALITDTLAKIYVKQGLHAKAIYAYERLSLKYPEKSAYFAAQIEKIKNNANV